MCTQRSASSTASTRWRNEISPSDRSPQSRTRRLNGVLRVEDERSAGQEEGIVQFFERTDVLFAGAAQAENAAADDRGVRIELV